MKTKAFFALLSMSVLISSCELLDPFLNPTSSACQLISTSFSIPDDPAHTETEYVYDTSDKLIEVTRSDYDLNSSAYVDRWEITYSGNKVDQIKKYFTFLNDPEELMTTFTFYFTGDFPDSIASFSDNGYQQTYAYSLCTYTNNKITHLTEHRYYPIDSTSALYKTIDFVWAGENISKITSQFANIGTTISEYEYDDKKAPMDHLGLSFVTFGTYTMLSKHNVTSVIITLLDGSIRNTSFTINYNDQDYPISTKPSDYYTTTYTYTCK